MSLDKILLRGGTALAILTPMFKRAAVTSLAALIILSNTVRATIGGHNRMILSKILMGIGTALSVLTLVSMTSWPMDPAMFAAELIVKLIMGCMAAGMISAGQRMRDRR